MHKLSTIVRATLGGYVAMHFIGLLPYAVELFSNIGMLPQRSASPLMKLFPNVLALSDAPLMAFAVVLLGALSGLALMAGKLDRTAAALALYIFACLFGRNPLIANPSAPYIGLLLFAWAASPRDDDRPWTPAITRALWIVMALGYTYSGITKLAAPSWIDGSAFAMILDNPLARDGLARTTLLLMPGWVLAAMTWGVLAFEIVFAPLALWSRSRPWLWGGMLAMHIGLLVLIDFGDLTMGMVVLHVATFDPRWIKRTG